MATMESPKNVASPEVVATQRLGAGGRGQQAASPAAVLAETGQALGTAGGSSQVSLLHVLGSRWSRCSSRVVQPCTAHPPWPPGEQPVLGTCQPLAARLSSVRQGHLVEAL